MLDWKSEIQKRLRGLRIEPEREAEMLDELSLHMQDNYDELRASGLSHEDARRDVIAELDSTDLVSELQSTQRTRLESVPEGAPRTGAIFFDFFLDLRYAARTFRKSPGFTAVAILTLALGIGANAAVFTVINSLILNPLPVDHISTLVAINTTQKAKVTQLGDLQLLSYPNFLDLRDRAKSFTSFAAHSNPTAVTMIDKDQPRRVQMELVTANYFETLGLHPSQGRFFLPDEDTKPGAATVAVLGYSAWQNRFGARPNIVGETIKLNNIPFTIIGVGPKEFKGLYAVFGPDLWIPSSMAREFLPTQQQNALTDRSIPLVTGIGRLPQADAFTQTQAEMKIASAALDNEYPDTNLNQSLVVRHLSEAAYGPEGRGLMLGGMLLAAIVAIVLLIACSNVANLLLARTAARRPGRFSFANILLGAQVAGSLVLLVIAAIFLHSIEQQYTIDPGYQTSHLSIFMLYPGQAGYDQPRTEQFYKQVRERVSNLPGTASLSWASNMPLWGRKETNIVIEGQEQRKKSDAISSMVNTIDVDYFSTLGVNFVSGRDFTQDDRDISTPVGIINDTMAAQYWPNQNPLGKRLKLPQGKDFLQIVGVVKTTNYGTLGEPPQPCIFIPLRQNFSDAMVLYVKSQQDPTTILSAVTDQIHLVDPALAVEDIRTGTKIIEQALWWSKIALNLLAVFGFLALGLASVGLYGIMAYSVNQRRREIGVRMALGASQSSVALLILRQGLTVVLGGLTCGVAIALLLGRGLSGFLYGVKGTDYLSLGGASLVLLIVAFVACYLPARSASGVDPLTSLRDM